MGPWGPKLKADHAWGKKNGNNNLLGHVTFFPIYTVISTQDPSKMDEFCWQNMAKHPWIGRSQRFRFIFN